MCSVALFVAGILLVLAIMLLFVCRSTTSKEPVYKDIENMERTYTIDDTSASLSQHIVEDGNSDSDDSNE